VRSYLYCYLGQPGGPPDMATLILSCPTPQSFLKSRLTIDMETQLMYIMTQVGILSPPLFHIWLMDGWMHA
jgi:hypothetical protein